MGDGERRQRETGRERERRRERRQRERGREREMRRQRAEREGEEVAVGIQV